MDCLLNKDTILLLQVEVTTYDNDAITSQEQLCSHTSKNHKPWE